jgi:hypothetical protein
LSERAFELLDEYAAAYARGERPRAEEYLARAGSDAAELARLLDGFVSLTPVPAPGPSEVAAFMLWLEPESGLSERRRARGLTLDAVVDALVERLGLDHAKREKVKRYYRELETGVLDAPRVHRRVWDALAAVIGPAGPATWRSARAQPAIQVMHKLAYDAAPAGAARAEEPAAGPPSDEVDRLFQGGD